MVRHRRSRRRRSTTAPASLFTHPGVYADEQDLIADIEVRPVAQTVRRRDNPDMEIVYIIAGVAVGVMLAELLLPTGGVLAVIGAAGLVAAGVIALGEDSRSATTSGPG